MNRKMLWRAVWLAVLLLHIPASFRVFSLALIGDSSWSGALLIAATNLLFILEIIFGWSLKVLTDRRRIITFLVVVALLHVGVIDHSLPGISRTDFSAWLVLTAGGISLLKRCTPLIREFASDWRRIVFQIDRLRRRALYDLVVAQRSTSHLERYLMPSRPHRAPPL